MSELNLSIVVPFKDKSTLTIACLDSLIKYSHPVREILLVSNNSTMDELNAVRQRAALYANTKVVEYDHPYNFHSINNWAVAQTKGEVVFLLNNDIELVPESMNLLDKMYKKAREPSTGIVGCVLLYGDRKTIQHAGVYMVPGGTADHLYSHRNYSRVLEKIKHGEYVHDIRHDMRLTAVTAAAVMIERKKYDQIHGLNENFIICGGDVDLGIRAEEHGYTNWLIGAEAGYMIHKESMSRASVAIPYSDFVESYKTYVRRFNLQTGDPYLNWEVVKHEK